MLDTKVKYAKGPFLMYNNLRAMYMTIGEAALYLDVNRLTIRRWLKSGRLNGERIGHFTLILKDDVRRIAIQERMVASKGRMDSIPK